MPVKNADEIKLNIIVHKISRVVQVRRLKSQQLATFTQALCRTLLRKQIFVMLLQKSTIYARYVSAVAKSFKTLHFLVLE